MFLIAGAFALLLQACSGVTVTHGPSDVAVEVGHNATLACMVTNKLDSENVQWKHRANSSSTFNAVTFNENVLGSASKYGIVGTYNLTVINAAFTDEGTYRCTAGTVDYDAYLTVADLPETVSISWSSPPNSGDTVNLTCTATNARPTPTLRWLINGVDLTQRAIAGTGAATNNGTGTTTSSLPLTLNSGLDGNMAICYVSYPGWTEAMNTTLILDINGCVTVAISTLLMCIGAFLSTMLN